MKESKIRSITICVSANASCANSLLNLKWRISEEVNYVQDKENNCCVDCFI